MGLIPGSGRSPVEGNGMPFQDSCFRNPMDDGAWQATDHGVGKELGHDLVTKQTNKNNLIVIFKIILVLFCRSFFPFLLLFFSLVI